MKLPSVPLSDGVGNVAKDDLLNGGTIGSSGGAGHNAVVQSGCAEAHKCAGQSQALVTECQRGLQILNGNIVNGVVAALAVVADLNKAGSSRRTMRPISIILYLPFAGITLFFPEGFAFRQSKGTRFAYTL